MSKYTGTQEQRSVILDAGIRTGLMDDDTIDAKRSLTWAIRTYNEGVNIPLNFDVNIGIRLPSRPRRGALDVQDIVYEIADNETPASFNDVAQLFYYCDVPFTFDDNMEDYIENGQNYEIKEIMQYGVFVLAQYLVEQGYRNRDDGEV